MQQTMAPSYRAKGVAETIKIQGRSVSWVARQLGVSRQYTSDVIHGNRPVNRETADRISALLGLPFFLAWNATDGAESATEGSPQ